MYIRPVFPGSVTLFMFANDTKLYHAIKSKDDGDILQQDLDNITDWGRIWLTNFNSRKCKVFFWHTSNFYSKYILIQWHNYPDGLYHLIRVDEEKDLGVLFSST